MHWRGDGHWMFKGAIDGGMDDFAGEGIGIALQVLIEITGTALRMGMVEWA